MASLMIMSRARGARPGRTVAAIALLAIAALAGPSGVATAESGIKSAAVGGGDGTDRSVLAEAMLQAEDIPSWLPAGDAEPTDDTHFPEFNANAGLRGVLRTWHDMDVIGTLVEFIWQFPDADAGASFLDDAESALSEPSSGSVREEIRREPAPRHPLLPRRRWDGPVQRVRVPHAPRGHGHQAVHRRAR